MTQHVYYLTETQFEGECTKIKNIIITFLRNENYISHEVYEDMTLNYGIIIKKPSFFHRLWRRKKISHEKQYIIVKQVTLKELPSDKDQKTNLVLIDTKKEK